MMKLEHKSNYKILNFICNLRFNHFQWHEQACAERLGGGGKGEVGVCS